VAGVDVEWGNTVRASIGGAGHQEPRI
jgi:hypothetical protein